MSWIGLFAATIICAVLAAVLVGLVLIARSLAVGPRAQAEQSRTQAERFLGALNRIRSLVYRGRER